MEKMMDRCVLFGMFDKKPTSSGINKRRGEPATIVVLPIFSTLAITARIPVGLPELAICESMLLISIPSRFYLPIWKPYHLYYHLAIPQNQAQYYHLHQLLQQVLLVLSMSYLIPFLRFDVQTIHY